MKNLFIAWFLVGLLGADAFAQPTYTGAEGDSLPHALAEKFPGRFAARHQRVHLVFVGGAGPDTPPQVAERAVAIARAFATVWQASAFAKSHELVVLDGSAPGLPDLAVNTFVAAMPQVATVGFSPMKTAEDHRASGSPETRDVIVLTDGIPGSRERGGVATPAYVAREIAMINRKEPTIVVSLGGRFGTGQELAIALDAGKVVALSRGTGGLSNMFHQVVNASAQAGKAPRAPVIVSPDFARVGSGELQAVAEQYAGAVLKSAMKSFAAGPTQGHVENASNHHTGHRMTFLRRTTVRRSGR